MLKDIILNITNNKDAKVLMTNFASLSVMRLIGYIFPLITLPYLARVIGVDGFGEIAFAAAVMIYFETFTNFGFNYTATRDIARIKNDTLLVSKIFSNVLFSKIILMLISVIVLGFCVYFIPFMYDKRVLLLITFLYIPGHIIFPDWFFQAQEKMVYITILNFISKLIFTLLVFIVIKEPSDYTLYPLLTACGYWMSGIIAMYIILKRFGVKLILPSWNDITETIKGSKNMFVSLFLPNLYTNFSTIILRVYGGSAATGIYSNGFRFISLSDQLFEVFSRTFFPFLSRRIDKHKIYVIISGFISVLASLMLFLLSDLIVDIFYTEEFKDSALVIKIMSICPIALFLMNTYGPNYLVW